MKEEDYFRDQRDRDRRSNFVGSYRRPGSSEFFNPAADILAGIEGLESSINKRKRTVSDFENAAAIRNQEIMSSIADMEGMEDSSALDSLQADLIAQAEELHRLDIASFEGDRSAYLKKSNQINKIANEIPALMGLIDADGTTLEEAIMSGKGLDKSVLRSNKKDYYNFVDDARKGGKNISFRINENGNIIAQLKGKDVFNGSAYIKSKEKGFDLINYVKDYSKEMTAIDAEASKGLSTLISSSKIEEIKKRGYVDTNEQKDYIEAANAYKKALERNIGIDAITNESTFQTFIGGEEPYQASKEQNAKTKEAIIDKMLRDKFPQAVIEDGVVKSAIGNKGFTRKVDDKQRTLDFNKQLAEYKSNKEKELLRLKEAFKQKDQKEFEESLDFFLNRNIYHTKEVSKLKNGSKERAEMLVTLLNETGKGKVAAYEVKEDKDGIFRVVDGEGEIVSSLDTPTGVYETLNEFEIMDDLEGKEVKDKAKTYLNSRSNEIVIKNNNQAGFNSRATNLNLDITSYGR
tara:strand:+ start:9461 stop:11017 length:1557 start_codon:yes stop_codon:yes gene_type:complete